MIHQNGTNVLSRVSILISKERKENEKAIVLFSGYVHGVFKLRLRGV